MRVDPAHLLGRPQCHHQLMGAVRVANDNTVDRDRRSSVDSGRVNPDNPLVGLEEVQNGAGRNVLGDGGQQAHVLHDTDRMTLWSLHGAHESPRGAVKLTRSQELA